MGEVMSELSNDSTSKLPTVAEADTATESSPAPVPEAVKACISATHAVLFESEAERCSVCDAPVSSDGADEDEGWNVGGRGLLVWARGDERRYEEPHLCPSCASAIGVTALQRWEIEEDEG